MSLAKFNERWPDNIVGPFYVHTQCLDCAVCMEIAPEIFARSTNGYSFVKRQPVGAEEEGRARQAIDTCPMAAIADDGLDFDSLRYPATAFVSGGSRDPNANSRE